MHSGNIVTFYSGSYIERRAARASTAGRSPASSSRTTCCNHNAYGIFGSGQAYGSGTLTYYAPGAVVQRNVMASNASLASRYPADNQFPSARRVHRDVPAIAAAYDYRLRPGSPYLRAGIDGQDLGLRLRDAVAVACPPLPPDGPAHRQVTPIEARASSVRYQQIP